MANTDEPRHGWQQEERGGRIDHSAFPGSPLDDDARVDESIAESFPASDPPSRNSGLEKAQER